MNIGIIGCSKIVYLSIIIPSQLSKTVTAYGIASRSYEKAVDYAKRCKIPVVFKSYDDLLNCADIDSVYIALPNHLHKEMIIKAAEHKKHILVEKPICLTYQDFETITNICNNNGVYILEALMIQHHPWQHAVKEYVINSDLGKLKKIETKISFIPKYDIKENYRAFPEYGGGCFYDLAPYWLQFIQTIIGLDLSSFKGRSAFDGPNQCDYSFSAALRTKEDVSADFSASFQKPLEANHELTFEQGKLSVNNFFATNVGKHKFILKIDKNLSGLQAGNIEEIVFPAQNYYMNQLEFFADVIAGKEKNLDIAQSGERIKLLENIYIDAKNHRGETNEI